MPRLIRAATVVCTSSVLRVDGADMETLVAVADMVAAPPQIVAKDYWGGERATIIEKY
jgi:hypothetical protein